MRKAFHGRADSRSDPRVASRASVRRPIDRGRLRTTITLLWGPSRQQVFEQEKSQVRQDIWDLRCAEPAAEGLAGLA